MQLTDREDGHVKVEEVIEQCEADEARVRVRRGEPRVLDETASVGRRGAAPAERDFTVS